MGTFSALFKMIRLADAYVSHEVNDFYYLTCTSCRDVNVTFARVPKNAEKHSIPGQTVYKCRRCGKEYYCDAFAEAALLPPEEAYRLCLKKRMGLSRKIIKGTLIAVFIFCLIFFLAMFPARGFNRFTVGFLAAVILSPGAYLLSLIYEKKSCERFALRMLGESAERLSNKEYLNRVLIHDKMHEGCYYMTVMPEGEAYRSRSPEDILKYKDEFFGRFYGI